MRRSAGAARGTGLAERDADTFQGEPRCRHSISTGASFCATLAAGAATPFGSLAFAQGRAETLVLVQELGPNSLDMQGVGSNQTVNGLSWNCYDRLMTYAAKTLADGTLSYDRATLAPELAESWEIAPDGMSVHLQAAQGRDLSRRHAGHREGREMVVRPLGLGRRISDLPDVGGQPRKAGAVRRGRRSHVPRRLHPQGQDADVQPRGGRAVRHQFRTRQEERDRTGPVGAGVARRPTKPAAARTRSKAGSRAPKPSSRASTTGRAGRCRRSSA